MASSDSSSAPTKKMSLYRRLEVRVLSILPAFVTPLRLRIFLGYLVVLLLAIYGWEQITTAWRYVATLMAPVAALLGALIALKVSVVFVSLVTLLSALVKLFIGFLMVVIKPGILKAIFVPQLMALVTWFHRKSARIQDWVRKIYDKVKAQSDRILGWWKVQSLTDKVLLSGFIVPLLLVVLIVFVVKRAIAIFAFKKLTEQVVQRTTRFVLNNFYRMPVIGGVPAYIAATMRKLTLRDDRNIVVDDLKELGREFYQPDNPQSEKKG